MGGAIFLLAFALRVIYVNQLGHTYFFAPFKGGFDDYVFDNWAREMLKNNWVGNASIFIYRMPLYAYFLWFVYYLFGHSYWAVYILQAGLAGIYCALIYTIGSKLGGKIVGAAAGILSAFYGASIYYTGMLVGETLSILINCMSLLLLLSFQRSERLSTLFLAGISLGVGMLARGNMLVVFPFIILWLAFMFGKDRSRKVLVYSAVISLGALLAIAPIMIRNYIYTKDIVPISAQGGLNIYIGNAYGADGRFRSIEGVGSNLENMIPASVKIAEEKLARPLKPSEVSNFWVKETARSINDHGGIWFLVPLLMKKIALFWNNYELPDIWDYYFFKQYIPILNMPLAGFSVIASLAFAGMYLTWKKRREMSLLYVFIFGYMASLVIVFITSRYRLPVVPLLTVFAGFAVAALIRPGSAGAPRAGIAMTIFVLIFILSHSAVQKISFETSHNSLAILLKRNGNINGAIEEYNKALRISPNYPSPYYNLGILYQDQGQSDQAAYYFNKALKADPNFEPARKKLTELSE